eukprot:14144686-Heterocapsa_arctica.AAC.1
MSVADTRGGASVSSSQIEPKWLQTFIHTYTHTYIHSTTITTTVRVLLPFLGRPPLICWHIQQLRRDSSSVGEHADYV